MRAFASNGAATVSRTKAPATRLLGRTEDLKVKRSFF